MPRLIGTGLVTALMVTTFLCVEGEALAAHVQCGDVITQDTTLDSDLIDCPGNGIVIGAPGITLDLGGHVIDGDGVPGTEAGVANVREGPFPNRAHANVTIRGGTIREFRVGVGMVGVVGARVERMLVVANGDGIALNDAYDTAVDRSFVYGNAGRGIEGIDLERNRFERNIVSDNGSGLDLVSSREGIVARNRVEDNGEIGILVQDGVSDNVVIRNHVSGNGHAGIVVFEGTRRNRVEENVVTGNGNLPGTHYFEGGILVDRENHVARNSVSGNSIGIVLWFGGRNSVVANTVSGNRRGIDLREGAGNLVEGNRVFRNNQDGIVGGDQALIVRNIVSLNGQDGIGAFTSSRVVGNVVSGNGSIGVSPGGTHSSIARNVIFGNGHGVWLDEPTVRENTIMRNSIWGNAGEGVYVLEHADRNEIGSNLVFRNGGAGILVGDAGDSRIEGNRVWENQVGIRGHSAYGLEISGNSATANALDGILVEPFEPTGSGHLVSDNIARRNGDDGIDVENADTTLSGNRAYLNVDLGIEAVPGVVDGGRNRAFRNGNPLQCLNIFCK